eukprot:c5992_g1_i1.p1 GENE.c5992_g1_i1~~c5992_g1_i1.p1  ORF type:complete len:235 (+),score=66.55 c5992_g1_i1:75-779(+)
MDFVADIEEIRSFIQQAKRPAVLKLLRDEELRLEKLTSEAKQTTTEDKVNVVTSTTTPSEATSADTTATNPKKAEAPNVTYLPINTYAWDQTSSHIKIFFDLNDVGSLDKASIFFTAKKHVVELSFVGLEGKNHKFKIPNLHGEVSTSESSFKAKPNKVVVTLKKVKNEHWPDIKENAKLKKATEKSGDADPSAGLMNIMRDMYNDGDEETKRMIAKAWTESRDKSSRGAGDFV